MHNDNVQHIEVFIIAPERTIIDGIIARHRRALRSHLGALIVLCIVTIIAVVALGSLLSWSVVAAQ